MMKKTKKRLFILLLIFAVVSAVVGYWYWQKNVYSKDVLKLEILGPESVGFAESFDYAVKYKNNGTVRLEDVKLIFEYPKHSIAGEGKNLWQEIPLEDIYPGEEKNLNFKARLIGKENELFNAKATLSFNPKNLKARYDRTTNFTTQIKSFPLTFEFDLPSKIEAGKDFNFRLNYFSNIDYPILDLSVVTEYPLEFEFISSKPVSLEKTEWELPPLNKAEGGRIEIAGSIKGNIGEQEIFKAKLGIWQNGEFILLKEIARAVEIINPSLLITQQINGNPNYVANPGGLLHYEIFFKNVGNDTLKNLTLVDALAGDIFDFQTLQTLSGNFTSGDNSIVWDWKKEESLQFLDPREEGRVEFWIKLKSDSDISSLDGKSAIKNTVYLGQAKEEFSTKVNSKLEISQKGYFQDEIFGNSGPIPPRAGETTTYTINWQAKNYYNETKNVKVKAILPPNVQLTGKFFPDELRLTFDSQSREIVWEVGDLSIGQGVINPASNISFQISFTPTSFHVGQTPIIVNQAKITGEDNWTNDTIEGRSPSVNTTLPDDPSINLQGVVR